MTHELYLLLDEGKKAEREKRMRKSSPLVIHLLELFTQDEDRRIDRQVQWTVETMRRFKVRTAL